MGVLSSLPTPATRRSEPEATGVVSPCHHRLRPDPEVLGVGRLQGVLLLFVAGDANPTDCSEASRGWGISMCSAGLAARHSRRSPARRRIGVAFVGDVLLGASCATFASSAVSELLLRRTSRWREGAAREEAAAGNPARALQQQHDGGSAAERTQHGAPYRGMVDSTRLVGLKGWNRRRGDAGGVADKPNCRGAMHGELPASADGRRTPMSCAVTAHKPGSSPARPPISLSLLSPGGRLSFVRL